MNFVLALVLKPFVAVLIFFGVYLIALGVWRLLPEGRLKRILFSPLPGHRGKTRRWY